MFEIFKAPRSGDFSAAQIYRYRRIEPAPGDKVLARFDDGAVAAVERKVGAGRVIVWASALDTSYSDLPLKPVYLPLVTQLVKYLAQFEAPHAWQTVGQVVDVQSLTKSRANWVVVTPSGKRVTSTGPLELDEQGVYEVRPAGSADGFTPQAVAVNIDPAEEDLTPIDPAELVAACHGSRGIHPSARCRRRRKAEQVDIRTPKKQSFWWYCHVTGLAATRGGPWCRIACRMAKSSVILVGVCGAGAEAASLRAPLERRAELLEVIDRSERWRQKLAVRGVVLVVAGTLLALFLSASSLEALRFSPGAIISFRLIAVAVFAALVWQFLVRPLRRRVSDTQVAMYLEENDPKLEAAILSAIEATSGSMISQDHSPRLVEKLVEQAIDQCHDAMAGHHVDRRALKRHAMALGGVPLAALLLVVFGPAYLRHGLSALLIVTRAAEKASPYSSEVTPGDAKVARGAISRSRPPRRLHLGLRQSLAQGRIRAHSINASATVAFRARALHLEKGTVHVRPA